MKKTKKMYALFVLILVSILFSTTENKVFAEDNSQFLRAGEIARNDFAEKMAGRDKDEWEYSDYFSKIENYSMGLADDRRYYIIVFIPRKIRDVRIKGGGATYYVEKENMKIAHIVLHK